MASSCMVAIDPLCWRWLIHESRMFGLDWDSTGNAEPLLPTPARECQADGANHLWPDPKSCLLKELPTIQDLSISDTSLFMSKGNISDRWTWQKDLAVGKPCQYAYYFINIDFRPVDINPLVENLRNTLAISMVMFMRLGCKIGWFLIQTGQSKWVILFFFKLHINVLDGILYRGVTMQTLVDRGYLFFRKSNDMFFIPLYSVIFLKQRLISYADSCPVCGLPDWKSNWRLENCCWTSRNSWFHQELYSHCWPSRYGRPRFQLTEDRDIGLRHWKYSSWTSQEPRDWPAVQSRLLPHQRYDRK